MRKYILIAVLTAIALGGCTSEDEVTTGGGTATGSQTQQQAQVPVSFGTYMGRSTSTRAAEMVSQTTGAITTTEDLRKSSGFGVFAYYTNTASYPTTAGAAAPPFKPDFMYNERIYDATPSATDATWTYWPEKFWPNDFANGDVDNQNATGSQAGGIISFFAYAPYTGKDDTAADPDGDGTVSGNTTGITGITGSDKVGDPRVTYVMAAEGKVVDLLWGTANSSESYSVAAGSAQSGATVQYGTGTSAVTGKAAVNVNLTKQTIGEKVNFLFKHALAKIGGAVQASDKKGDDSDTRHGLQVMLDVDTQNGGLNPANTIVTIKTITIENDGLIGATTTTDGEGTTTTTRKQENLIPKTGQFDLATGIWDVTSADASKADTYTTIQHTITSGASSAEETSASDATIAIDLAEPASVSTWDDLKNGTSTLGGVKTSPQNVYETEAEPLVFFPGTKPVIKITIEYVVRTKDVKLEKGYSEAIQKISKVLAFNSEVELNKRYNLVMHLGLTSVKFEASVDEWDGGDATKITTGSDGSITVTDSDTGKQVHLPINVETTP